MGGSSFVQARVLRVGEGRENRRLADSMQSTTREPKSVLYFFHTFKPSKLPCKVREVESSISRHNGLPCTTPFCTDPCALDSGSVGGGEGSLRVRGLGHAFRCMRGTIRQSSASRHVEMLNVERMSNLEQGFFKKSMSNNRMWNIRMRPHEY